MNNIKFDFDDNSFLSVELENDKVLFIMCGKKNLNSVVMSSSIINKEQVIELTNFLKNWLEKEKK